MIFSMIVAAAENDVIGRDGALPWRIRADSRRFRALTTGHVVLLGRVTHDSIVTALGRPLPGRTSVVITRAGAALPPAADGTGPTHAATPATAAPATATPTPATKPTATSPTTAPAAPTPATEPTATPPTASHTPATKPTATPPTASHTPATATTATSPTTAPVLTFTPATTSPTEVPPATATPSPFTSATHTPPATAVPPTTSAPDRVLWAGSVQAGLELAAHAAASAGDTEVFIAGGVSIYRDTLAATGRIYLTRVHHVVAGDRAMPPGWLNGFELVRRQDGVDEESQLSYSFLDYERACR
jgi:dihydrofolate reductase